MLYCSGMTNDELQKLATKATGDDDMSDDEQVQLMAEVEKDLKNLADELEQAPSSDRVEQDEVVPTF